MSAPNRIAYATRPARPSAQSLGWRMRPSVLNPLFAAITTLAGVGPRLEKLYRRLFGREQPARVIDLLFHLPAGVIDRRARPKLRDVMPDTVVTVAVSVDRHRPPPPYRPRAPYQVYTSDETGDLILTYFNARRDYLERLLPIGERRYVSGTVELYDHMLQMVHPDRVVAEADLPTLPLVEPVYPLTEGLSLNQVGKAALAALARLPDMPEWQEPSWVARERFPSFADALRLLHRPNDPADILPEGLAWSRLAYDEFLAGQLALALVRAHLRRPAGRATPGTGQLRKKLIDALPYSLTPSQQRAVAEIIADLAKPERMLRLLQGDVGSGKTVVALLASAAVIEAGRQAALMAPTEILARQHFATISGLAEATGLRAALLTGRERGRERTDILARLAGGEIDLLIGTHALFQEQVEFRDLALAVVDEQHRFGVHQRLALGMKGADVDVLVMTATPIPRTLVLTYFGDMEVSEIGEHQRARYRRRGHHQHVDVGALHAERQPLVHAEAMLLVHHGEREIAKFDLLLEERVRADEQVDLTAGEARQDVSPLAAALAPGEQRRAQAGSLRQSRDGRKMLARQNFGRRHQGCLPAGLDHGRGGKQRNNGLARPDIALQETQHA